MRRERDCLKIFRAQVLGSGAMSQDQLSAIDAEVSTKIDEAVRTARAAPRPDPKDVEADVYVSYA